jgi:hypothetical protein
VLATVAAGAVAYRERAFAVVGAPPPAAGLGPEPPGGGTPWV